MNLALSSLSSVDHVTLIYVASKKSCDLTKKKRWNLLDKQNMWATKVTYILWIQERNFFRQGGFSLIRCIGAHIWYISWIITRLPLYTCTAL